MAAARPFVVTGCGRSGTLYASMLLRGLGVACGHEEVFHPMLATFKGFGDAEGDASWLAVPFIRSLPPSAVVLHQVRDPLAVCASFTAMGFFQTGPLGLRSPRHRPFVRFLRRHQPDAFRTANPQSGAARHWLDWNRKTEADACARGLDYARYRIEDMTPDGWVEMLERVGVSRDRDTVRAPLEQVPTTANHRKSIRTFDPCVLDDGLRAELTTLAEAYGYVRR